MYKEFIKAVMMLVLGTVLAAIFADPLVDAVDEFSDATRIPTFFISFIALPLATNASETVSAIIFASHKRQRTASLTFSEVRFALRPSFFYFPFLSFTRTLALAKANFSSRFDDF